MHMRGFVESDKEADAREIIAEAVCFAKEVDDSGGNIPANAEDS